MAQTRFVLALIALSGLKLVLSIDINQSDQTEPLTPVDSELASKTLALASTYGLPSEDNLRLFNSFLLSYDRRIKGPKWVIEVLNRKNFMPSVADIRKAHFKPDTSIPKRFRSNNTDFMFDVYDRGHQASARNYLSNQTSMNQAFTLSNVLPQTPVLNRGCWDRLEKYVAFLAKRRSTKYLFVITGPLYAPKRDSDGKFYAKYQFIGDNRVAVPTHFFKVFLRETTDNELIMDAFVMPNIREPGLWDVRSILKFRVPLHLLDEIEQNTGLIFFGKLERRNVIQPDGFEFDYADARVPYRAFDVNNADDSNSDDTQYFST